MPVIYFQLSQKLAIFQTKHSILNMHQTLENDGKENFECDIDRIFFYWPTQLPWCHMGDTHHG
jgi:hypothetical protein